MQTKPTKVRTTTATLSSKSVEANSSLVLVMPTLPAQFSSLETGKPTLNSASPTLEMLFPKMNLLFSSLESINSKMNSAKYFLQLG